MSYFVNLYGHLYKETNSKNRKGKIIRAGGHGYYQTKYLTGKEFQTEEEATKERERMFNATKTREGKVQLGARAGQSLNYDDFTVAILNNNKLIGSYSIATYQRISRYLKRREERLAERRKVKND